MKLRIISTLLVMTLFITGCNNDLTESNNTQDDYQASQTTEEKGDNMREMNKATALKFISAFTTGDSEILNNFHKDYKMHRPEYPSNMETMASFFPGEPWGMKTTNIRSFVDDDIVVTHNYTSEYPGARPFISIDILAFKDGEIAHYWDNMTPEVEDRTNAHTQYDGATEVTDINKTDENKALVEKYTKAVHLEKNISAIDTFVSNETLIQHAPTIKDGKDALKDYLKTAEPQYTKLKKILGEGNFVLAICDGILNEQAATFYNLYRIENGLIIEHWEVLEINADEADWANTNGRTNFDD